jgi:hypothetical protein
MNRLNSETIDNIKEAVYQDKPYLVLTFPNLDEMKLTFRGDEYLLVAALIKAMEHDKDFNRMVNRALKKKKDSEFMQRNRTLKLPFEIPNY